MQNNTYNKQVRAIALALHKGEKKAVGLLLILTFLLGFLYIYFLGSAVVHAVVRREVQTDLARINSEIADLEVDYLNRKNDATSELAYTMGLTRVDQKNFIERTRYLGQARTQ